MGGDTRAFAGGALLTAGGAALVWAAGALPYGSLRAPGSGFFPFWTGLALAATGAWTALAALRETPSARADFELAGPATLTAAVLVYVAAFETAGFVVASAGLLWVCHALIERRCSWRGGVFGIAMASAAYALFAFILRLPLPAGRIWIG
jgi:hypothetical protein